MIKFRYFAMVLAVAAAMMIGMVGMSDAKPPIGPPGPVVTPPPPPPPVPPVPSFGVVGAKALWKEIKSKKSKVFVVDARTFQEYREGHIPGSINVPPDKFNIIGGYLPKNKAIPLVFYCRGVNCSLSQSAANSAFRFGYKNIRIFRGGMPEWLAAKLPVDRVIDR